MAVVGEKSSVLLQVISYNGESHNVPIQSIIKCVLVSEITHDIVKGGVERRGLSQLPAHHQGETPTPRQSGGPARQRKSISCSSVFTS